MRPGKPLDLPWRADTEERLDGPDDARAHAEQAALNGTGGSDRRLASGSPVARPLGRRDDVVVTVEVLVVITVGPPVSRAALVRFEEGVLVLVPDRGVWECGMRGQARRSHRGDQQQPRHRTERVPRSSAPQ